ncbi:MAG TPA: glycosyltransferase family protein [Sphingorhabdus sp.]|jgi:spore coat polysaccharide biosynthesis protein SpsF|nr:glycosyltransferase family protein [Sphingorhabdus sp.]
MRIVAIIQARMGSTRLPGKILKLLAGKPVLQHVVERTKASGAFDEVVVATTDRNIDNPAASAAATFGAVVVRGDENDVLSRYELAAKTTAADAIMRITADCPLIDPDVLQQMVGRFRTGDADLVSNCVRRTFPRGLDAELFSRAALDIMAMEATASSEREHVTPFLYANPDRFRIVSHEGAKDYSDYRLTLDTPEDFDLLERLFTATPDPRMLRLPQLIALFETHPDWRSINAHIEQKKI